MGNFNESRVDLPNASVILAFGIVSIVGCFCSNGILGIIFGVIALVMAKSAENLYVANPDQYTENSYKNVNTGKICAWIGLIPSIICLIIGIIIVVTLGWAALTNPAIIMEHFGQ